MDNTIAKQILEQVESDYNSIAEAFAESRMIQWYEVTYLVDQYVTPGISVLDLGCGNGRLAELVNERKASYVGVDVSRQLIDIAKKRYPNNDFRVGSIMRIDAPDNCFDVVFLIASFHHIPSMRLRADALTEIARVTKSGGTIIMLNWNRHQWRYTPNRWKWNIKKLFGRSALDWNDVLVPWKDNTGKVMAERYYHSFTKREMERLARVAQLTIMDQYFEQHGLHVPRRKGQNLVTVLKK